jgi:hypothetical protein
MEILGILCNHTNQTTPRRDEQGEYRRCLECGGRLPWSWPDDFRIGPPKLLQPRVSPTLRWPATLVWESRRRSA